MQAVNTDRLRAKSDFISDGCDVANYADPKLTREKPVFLKNLSNWGRLRPLQGIEDEFPADLW